MTRSAAVARRQAAATVSGRGGGHIKGIEAVATIVGGRMVDER
jgi:hypothetical protein